MNNHQHISKLLRCSKPSKWRQPSRETRNPQPQRSPSATRCNHSSKCTMNHSQSHYDNESMMEMSGRCLLKLTKMSSMSKCQESEPQSGTFLFIVSRLKEPLGILGLTGRIEQTRTSVRSPTAVHMSPFELEPLKLIGHLLIARAVKR